MTSVSTIKALIHIRFQMIYTIRKVKGPKGMFGVLAQADASILSARAVLLQ